MVLMATMIPNLKSEEEEEEEEEEEAIEAGPSAPFTFAASMTPSTSMTPSED